MEENKNLEELQSDQKMLKEEVDSEDVAEVVAKWTGIPVARMMEGERDKLLKMEERLAQRVVGQKKGSLPFQMRCVAPDQDSRIPTDLLGPLYFWGRPVWARQNLPGRLPSFCLTMNSTWCA